MSILCRIAFRTNSDSATDVGHSITYDVTILTTTKYRTIDTSIACDVDLSIDDVRPSVEEDTLVTLTSTKKVTRYRVSGYLIQGARYTKCATHHIDGTLTSRLRYDRFTILIVCVRTHIRMLITTIDAGQDMTTGDVHHRIATYNTCRTVPFTWCIWYNTTTTTKDVSIIGMTILSYIGTTLCVICMSFIIIILILTAFSILIFSKRVVRCTTIHVIIPVGALWHKIRYNCYLRICFSIHCLCP